jgi:hypothetical protein
MNLEIWRDTYAEDLYNMYKIFLNQIYKFNSNIDRLTLDYNFEKNLDVDYFESNEFIQIFIKFLYDNK